MTLTQKLISIYKIWHEFLPHFSKDSKYTLGSKIDSLFLETTELIIKGGYSDKIEKIISLKRASFKLDLLKFFLQVAWEIKSLDNKRYILLSEKIGDAGKMLGGWIKSLK
ncbi:MAG: four helix bundle protein [Candidatus Nealsonbacteria bacterium]|nr:four helix bundle protein [Candidatus Nealsonbacteria bacterium]